MYSRTLKEALNAPNQQEDNLKPMLHYFMADPITMMYKHMANMIETYGAEYVNIVIENMKKEGIL